ncbi:MAG TPA: S8 family serine peptidase, partial [Candidatus Limnocylindrales bacterium]
ATATPTPAPSAAANVAAAVPPPAVAAGGAYSADPTGRWIVVLNSGTNAATRSADQGRKLGFKADRTFGHAIRGYSARLSHGQVAALRGDPSVAMIVPDEKIEAEAQTIPTGISRVGATRSSVSQIDGVDQRVDADVAIVDTGIGLGQTDLNVVGGYNCSSATTTAWRDVYGHGTHVAGTVGAIDNGDGVVGVAPGVRLWAVKILNDSGEGLLSWYVCGLDWIAAQHDPNDPTRPLFEAINMSVTKWGRDDGNCGNTNIDILHRAICRLVASGVTVVAAAANDSGNAALRVPAAYSEVITVSALADTDGQPGGLGGHRCFPWGTYDYDDTFADFSNYGPVVDLMAPGKCIWSTIPGGYAYMSGTSMAAPHVTGAVALLKATRPGLTPNEVKQALQYMGNLGWKTATDPDRYHEKLLDVTRIGPRGDFAVSAGANDTIGEAGGAAQFPITVIRTATSFELIRLRVDGLVGGMTASFSRPSLYGFGVGVSTLTVNVPFGTPPGSYQITVSGDEHGNAHTAPATIVVRNDIPTAMPPTTSPRTGAAIGSTTLPIRVSWAPATDPSTGIAGYELQVSVDGGTWTAAAATSGTVRTVARTHTFGHLYQYRLRARDAVGNWSGWAYGPTFLGGLIQDRSSAVVYRGTWRRATSTAASGGTVTYATAAGALARTTFTGRAVAIVAPVGPTRGSAAIYIDGTYRGTLSFRARSGLSRDVVYAAAFPTLATHTIELRLVGNGRVDLD